MGALTVNRKRGEDCLKVCCRNEAPNLNQVSKRPRLSLARPDLRGHLTANSVVSRFYRYPEVVAPIKREIHAPCRRTRFGVSANSRYSSTSCDFRENSFSGMGNFLTGLFKKEKPTAPDGSRHRPQHYEVIDIDDDTGKGNVSKDSFMEEAESLEKARIASPPKGGHGDVDMLDNFEKHDLERTTHTPSCPGATVVNNANVDMDFSLKTPNLMILSNHEFDNMDLPVYKRLLNDVNKNYKDSTFSTLKFQIELHEKQLQTHQLLRKPKKPEELIEDVITEPFAPLTDEENAEVAHAFSGSNRRKVLVTHHNSNIDITGTLLQCLEPGKWLNDEVINVYLELLKERETREPHKFLKCHFFNTFFYKKLISGKTGYNYQSVRRWTSKRKLGYCIFECDKIFVPVHKEIHWCLAVINRKDKKFQYLDSLRGSDSNVLKALARYYVDEVKDKSGEDIDVNSWDRELVEDLPEQQNGFDCGMFMIKYADFYSRNIGLCFNQEHMPYFRVRTAKEILRLKAD
ncbi:unnamed protein product [Cuscuta epithymum]|uniref:Ubiquitin-like protease family profile domain-containing protein n=1 Tax=Cuscuta epithymum TaxID=186058 RepID=A0AAV0F2N8_9ASTE|nr:unnamed protein product [Cuscuta epithymum]CAH9129782.1 unnamed protein product [Cuscuta epithymum]